MGKPYSRQNQFWQKQREQEEAAKKRQDVSLTIACFADSKSEGLLGEAGPLARALPGYRPRPAQMRMARLVERAVAVGTNAVVEAGTGTGKSLAYLIPIIASGKKAVVATGTLALMNQLLRDLAFLKKNLGIPFTYAKQMGIRNYACRAKTYLPRPISLEEEHEEVIRWRTATETGDIGELSFDAKRSQYWELYRDFTTDSEGCSGRSCPKHESCYYYTARAEAQEANIVVTTHATVAQNLRNFGRLLPIHDVLVLDECHGWTDVARNSLEVVATRSKLRKLLRDLRSNVSRSRKEIEAVREVEEAFWNAFEQHLVKKRKPDSVDVRITTIPEKVAEPALVLCRALTELVTTADTEAEGMMHGAGRVRAYCEKLREVRGAIGCLASDQPNRVTWVVLEPGKPVKLHTTSTEVGGYLQSALKEGPKSVIYCSATLETNSAAEVKFESFRQQAGINSCLDLREKSPFNYTAQMLYYLPEKDAISSPKRLRRGHRDYESAEEARARYTADIVPHITECLNATKGRAFVLFTSYKGMDAAFKSVDVPYPCKTQRDMERDKLVEWFKRTPNSVLFATSTFWEGVDIPGKSLSCVIIDKIPFPSPSDPLQQALKDKYGKRAFYRFGVPSAIRHLQQGVGRLIRRETDRGLIVLLDPRLRTERYGPLILRELPGSPDKLRRQLSRESLGIVSRFIDGRAA